MTAPALHVEWLSDCSDCETCGGGSAEGARVTLNGAPFLDRIPRAACFGGDSWSADEVFAATLELLGYSATFGFDETPADVRSEATITDGQSSSGDEL